MTATTLDNRGARGRRSPLVTRKAPWLWRAACRSNASQGRSPPAGSGGASASSAPVRRSARTCAALAHVRYTNLSCLRSPASRRAREGRCSGRGTLDAHTRSSARRARGADAPRRSRAPPPLRLPLPVRRCLRPGGSSAARARATGAARRCRGSVPRCGFAPGQAYAPQLSAAQNSTARSTALARRARGSPRASKL